jgi:hypothetical protein
VAESPSQTTQAPKRRSPWFTPVDTAALPLTQPHHAPIFDTGPHPAPLESDDPIEVDAEIEAELASATDSNAIPEAVVRAYTDEDADLDPGLELEPVPPAPAPPVVVPGQYVYVKWWKFLLVTLGVWTVAAAAGLGFYYWWFHAMDKTWPDFAVLVYVVVCVVAAVLLGMAEQRPGLSMTSLAVLTAPFASGMAAAALYGMYVFGWITP